jgi:hypothetical protein
VRRVFGRLGQAGSIVARWHASEPGAVGTAPLRDQTQQLQHREAVVLDILVQARRDANAAKRFFKRLLKGLQYVPRVIVTDKLSSYGAAQRHLLPGVEHRQSR